MLALKMGPKDVRLFMNKLLVEDVFDFFEFREAYISSFIRFELNAQSGEPVSWKEIRPYAFNILKGGRKPASMRFVLSYPKDGLAGIEPSARALFLNIIFEEESVLITTGFSAGKFTLDKGPEAVWDAYVRDFLRNGGMGFEEQ